MDRRNFFRSMIGGVAAAAAVRTFPFRVYSFPENILIRSGVGEILLLQSWESKIEAIELETFRKEIPQLMRNDSILYRVLKNQSIMVQATRDGKLLGVGSGS